MVFKSRGKRKQLESPKQVARKCKSGEVDEEEHETIKNAVDVFLRKAGKREKVKIRGEAVAFSSNKNDALDIIASLRSAKVIPQNAKVLDFPERQTKKIDATPWIGMFKNKTKVHPDIIYNDSIAKLGTTVVYILECEKPISYSIFGRKKNLIFRTDRCHREELNGAGSWISFPSKNYHYGSGAKRKIISLIYLPPDS